MINFTVVEKDSLDKTVVSTPNITLVEASIIHTKMNRDNVAEFIREGDDLLLQLKSGKIIVITNFFVKYDGIDSDLVFEEDDCVLFWFDGASGFNEITGLEVLLPEASSQIAGLWPWLAGVAIGGGLIAASSGGGSSPNVSENKPALPNGVNEVEIKTDGEIIGNTQNIQPNEEVSLIIAGYDRDGNLIEKAITTTVNSDGSYIIDIPFEFVDGDLQVTSEVKDQNGNIVIAIDKAMIDRTDGDIEVVVEENGDIIGTTIDVAPDSDVKLTIVGKDKDGNYLEEEVVAKVHPDGTYISEVPFEFADGDITVTAEAIDRNGNSVVDTDNLLKENSSKEPDTPDQGGLDREPGAITVEIVLEENQFKGTTTDIAGGSAVTLTITGNRSSRQTINSNCNYDRGCSG